MVIRGTNQFAKSIPGTLPGVYFKKSAFWEYYLRKLKLQELV